MNWILQRAKAFAALLAVAVVTAAMSTVESYFGFTIPLDIKTTILGAVSFLAVHQTPNAQ